MKPSIKKAKKAVHTERTKAWMRPYMPGMVNHPVYSTWAMIRAMECAARKLIHPHFESGEDAVGVEVSARHIAPTAIGKTVRITAELKEIKGPIVISHLEAYSGKRKIGEGVHRQYVFSKKKYGEFIKKAKK